MRVACWPRVGSNRYSNPGMSGRLDTVEYRTALSTADKDKYAREAAPVRPSSVQIYILPMHRVLPAQRPPTQHLLALPVPDDGCSACSNKTARAILSASDGVTIGQCAGSRGYACG